jgi:hypothetical protein
VILLHGDDSSESLGHERGPKGEGRGQRAEIEADTRGRWLEERQLNPTEEGCQIRWSAIEGEGQQKKNDNTCMVEFSSVVLQESVPLSGERRDGLKREGGEWLVVAP